MTALRRWPEDEVLGDVGYMFMYLRGGVADEKGAKYST
jgi:hypothetical protein